MKPLGPARTAPWPMPPDGAPGLRPKLGQEPSDEIDRRSIDNWPRVALFVIGMATIVGTTWAGAYTLVEMRSESERTRRFEACARLPHCIDSTLGGRGERSGR